MRYLILGAGAIGGAIGGRLFQHGSDVVLVARGDHLEALQSTGLELRDPAATVTLPIRSVGHIGEATPRADDVVIIATKIQHSEGLLAELANVAPPEIAIVCAQNGVEGERLALRRFANVYGMRVILAGTHLAPGVVEIATGPTWGILDVGRYPVGRDETAATIAETLRAAGADAEATDKIMARKYLKLLSNVANAIEAACGTRTGDPAAADLSRRARAEARACYEAAGIEVADEEQEAERRRGRGMTLPAGGVSRLGGSSWQSLTRGTGNIEADWLNGEIVLLGRLHGVPTPVNARLQHVANRMAIERTPPGSISATELGAGLVG